VESNEKAANGRVKVDSVSGRACCRRPSCETIDTSWTLCWCRRRIQSECISYTRRGRPSRYSFWLSLL